VACCHSNYLDKRFARCAVAKSCAIMRLCCQRAVSGPSGSSTQHALHCVFNIAFYRCADGYYGNPTIAGGFCRRCGCNVAGSLDGVCNKTTGQCTCGAGISGRVCDQCMPRHVITQRGCISESSSKHYPFLMCSRRSLVLALVQTP